MIAALIIATVLLVLLPPSVQADTLYAPREWTAEDVNVADFGIRIHKPTLTTADSQFVRAIVALTLAEERRINDSIFQANMAVYWDTPLPEFILTKAGHALILPHTEPIGPILGGGGP